MNNEQLFEIAKIIDNEYIGKEKTFKSVRNNGYWWLTTDVCDFACFIRIYEINNKISTIQINGEYTEGWQDISSYTWGKIGKYLQSLNLKTVNHE